LSEEWEDETWGFEEFEGDPEEGWEDGLEDEDEFEDF
jgi:hypothetical protein